jgi:hypothetical protein
MGGVILAVLAICAVVSTKATREAGAIAVRPFARVALVISALVWAAVFFLPHG